jgi:GT2 family glycosyltransferase
MSKVSIVIVSWNACAYLRDCLRSIRNTTGSVVKEIIVVENASSDGSAEMVSAEFPEVILIPTGKNLGFARANNVGISQSSGSMVALINSDVLVHADCMQRLAAFLETNPEVGLVGPKVLNGDGSVQRTCNRLPTLWNTACHFSGLDRAFPNLRFFEGFQMSKVNHSFPTEIGALSGCFCVARRSAVEQVGGLDERFFFYAEDIDWCKRFKDASWKVMLVPFATATHFGGGSSANAPLRYSIEILRANLLYWKKHHGYLGRIGFYFLALNQHAFRLGLRSVLRWVAFDRSEFTRTKLNEHCVCIRWLLTGREV